jgi:hypothetical protein
MATPAKVIAIVDKNWSRAVRNRSTLAPNNNAMTNAATATNPPAQNNIREIGIDGETRLALMAAVDSCGA